MRLNVSLVPLSIETLMKLAGWARTASLIDLSCFTQLEKI